MAKSCSLIAPDSFEVAVVAHRMVVGGRFRPGSVTTRLDSEDVPTPFATAVSTRLIDAPPPLTARCADPTTYLSVLEQLAYGIGNPGARQPASGTSRRCGPTRGTMERRVLDPYVRGGRLLAPSGASWDALGTTLATLVEQEGLVLAQTSRSFIFDILIAHACREARAVLVSADMRGLQRIAPLSSLRLMPGGALRCARPSMVIRGRPVSVWRDTKAQRTLLAVPRRVRGAKGDGDSAAVRLEFSL